MPQGFSDKPYFFQMLNSDLDDITFPKFFTLLKYLDDFLFQFPFQVYS